MGIYLLRVVRRYPESSRAEAMESRIQHTLQQALPCALGPTVCRSPPEGCLAEKGPTRCALALPHVDIPGRSSWLRVWLPFPLLAGKGVDAWSCCNARHSDRTSASGSAPVCS